MLMTAKRGQWVPKWGRGELNGLGRGWRAKVRVEACARCYGSGECDGCDHTGSVFVRRDSGEVVCSAKWREVQS